MDLVNDVDLVAPACGRELRLLAKQPHVVDAAVRGRVHLHQIDERAGGNVAAVVAGGAGFGLHAFTTIDRFAKQARDGGLSGAAFAGEQVRVAQPVMRQGVLQNAHHVRLAHELAEPLRAVAVVERLEGWRRRGHRVRRVTKWAEDEAAPCL